MEYLFWKQEYTLIREIKSLWVINSIVLYPCVGYFCQNFFDKDIVEKNLFYLWIINISGIILSCLMTYYKGVYTGSFSESESQTFHENFVILNVIAIFLSFKHTFQYRNFPAKFESVILSLGKSTFGIYLIHPVIMSMKSVKSIYLILLGTGMNYMIAIFIQCFIIMMVCYFLILIIRQIPIMKKLI